MNEPSANGRGIKYHKIIIIYLDLGMIRDQFYQDIISKLEEKIDSELFERCAADLLRAYHPTIVPIRGGCD